MTKEVFLSALREKLAGLPQEDIDKLVDFYNEMLCDRVDAGMTEEEAVADLGSPEDIAREVMLDMPMQKLVKAKAKSKPKKRFTAGEILLIVMAFPVWGPLFCSLIAVVISVYCGLWAAVISVFAADLALVVSGIALVLGSGAMFASALPAGLLTVGGGLVCIGLGIFLFFICKLVTKGIVLASRGIWRGIKRLFI